MPHFTTRIIQLLRTGPLGPPCAKCPPGTRPPGEEGGRPPSGGMGSPPGPPKREVKYSKMAPLALAPLFPLAGLAVRRYPKLQLPVGFGLGAGVLVFAHYLGLEVSSG